MEILFRDDKSFCYIENGILEMENQVYHNIRHNTNWNNIKHLKDAEVLYHYRNPQSGILNPVYYEHDGYFITYHNDSVYILPTIYYTRDYTLINLKHLEK